MSSLHHVPVLLSFLITQTERSFLFSFYSKMKYDGDNEVMEMLKAPQSLFLTHGDVAVLLLHAYSGSPNDVRMLSRFLEKQAYTIYAPLFSGHGTLDPADILKQDPTRWWQESQAALAFLKARGYQKIAVFGLSMGGIFATRLVTAGDPAVIGGGFFCSPITPVKNNVVENFLLYAQKVLTYAKEPVTKTKLDTFKTQVSQQLQKIEQQALPAAASLQKIHVPFFMAQAGADEMIDPRGVFQTAQQLTQTNFTLKWYATSGHVITIDPVRREFEQDVAAFLATLKGAKNDE